MEYVLIYIGISVALTLLHIWKKRLINRRDVADLALTVILFPLLWPIFLAKNKLELFRSDPPFVRDHSFQCILKNMD